MPEANNNSRSGQRRWTLGALIGAVLLGLAATAGWYVRTPHFHAWVRGRVIANLEQVTGGRVELQSLTWNLPSLEFEVRDLTIHGREKAEEIPYAHVDRLLLRAKVLSLFRRQIGVRYIELERPIIHFIVYPDGTTSQPIPRHRETHGRSVLEQLFDLDVRHAEIRDGTLLMNDRPLPLQLAVDNLEFTLSYSGENRYDGNLRVDSFSTSYGALGTLSASLLTRFSLWSDRARLDLVQLSSGRSQIQAGGELRNFNHPVLDVTYDAALDAAQLGSMLRLPQLRGGTVRLSGQASGNAAEFSAAGKITGHGIDYLNRDVRLRDVSGRAEFTLSPDKLALSRLLVGIFGGTAAGEAQVVHWRGVSAPGRAALGQSGTVHLHVRDLVLPRMAAAVSTRSLPLDQLKLAGRVEGSIAARWQRSLADLVADIALNVTPPPSAAADELPLRGRLEGTYDRRRESLKLANLDLATTATRINAKGALGARTESLQVAVETHDLGEWKPALAAFGYPTRLPLELRGRASFHGSLKGLISAPAISGQLQISDFDTLVAATESIGRFMVPAAELGPRRVHWDTLTAEVEYSPVLAAAHSAVLKHGPAQIDLDASARLENGRLTETSPFTAQARLHNAEAADVLGLVGYNYPVTGTVNASLRLSGTEVDPHGSGSIRITGARIYGEPVQHLAADLRFAQHQAQLTGIDIAYDGAAVTGNAAYNPATTAYRFDLRGMNFSLARMSRIQTNRLALSGMVDFVAHGQGTKAAPAINADLQLRNLVINGERMGGLTVTASTAGDTLHLSARSDFEHANLDLDGTARLRGDFPAKLELRFNHVDVGPFIHMLVKSRITGHSAAAGTLTAEGSLRSPQDLTVAGNIDRFFLDVEHIQLHNEGPIRFTIGQRTLRVQQLQVAGTDTTLAAAGTVQLAGKHAVALDAKGHVNLKLLESIDRGIVSYGLVVLDLHVAGNLERPRIDGQVDIANAAISHLDLPNGLSDLNGHLVFTQDRLQVQNLTGKTGGGTLDIGGFVTFGRTAGFNLNARGHDIRLRYPPGVSAMADADLALTGNVGSALLSGNVTLTRFGVNPTFDFSSYLASAKQPGKVPGASSPLAHLRVDVHIVSTPELQVQTSLAKISGDVDLRLRGTGVRPVLLGRVNIIEGDIYFNATKYHLERGGILFTNPVTIQPVLDIEARTTVRDYDINLGFHGPIDKLSTTYRSDPPLATADIVSLLAFGRTRDETAVQSVQSAANLAPETQTILYQALNAAVSSRMQKLFGVSRIKIDPQAGGAENNPAGPRLTIEQQVANNITLTYITDVARANYQTIQAEYNLNPSVSIVAVRDWNGVVSFDIRIRQRKR